MGWGEDRTERDGKKDWNRGRDRVKGGDWEGERGRDGNKMGIGMGSGQG